jgi:hypothetical protein
MYSGKGVGGEDCMVNVKSRHEDTYMKTLLSDGGRIKCLGQKIAAM